MLWKKNRRKNQFLLFVVLHGFFALKFLHLISVLHYFCPFGHSIYEFMNV